MFGAYVAARRPQMGDPLTLQGASLYGADAVAKGAADMVGTLADAIATAATMAADLTRKTTMDTTATKSLETLATLRAQLDVTTDEEALATVATLRQRAGQLESVNTELAAARQQLADRDAAALSAAREAVFQKHTDRRAFTPAMRADAQYMADLAPLSPEALDRVLAKLPTMPEAVTPRSVDVDPTGAAVDPATVTLTDEDKAMAAASRISEEAFLATKRRDAARSPR